MKKHSAQDAPLRYVVLSKAWYGKANLDGRTTGNGNIPIVEEVWLTVDDGDVFGEFGFIWESLDCGPSVLLRAFHDSWHAMNLIPGFIKALAVMSGAMGRESPTPDDICAMLDGLGFVDATEKEDPYA